MAYPVGKLSFRNAALKTLIEEAKPLRIKSITQKILKKGQVKSTGKTPHNTISAALNRIIKEKNGIYKGIKLSKTKNSFYTATKIK